MGKKIIKNWSIEQWERVLWSDESLFVLSWTGKKMVWRRENEKYMKECIRGTVKGGSKKLIDMGMFLCKKVLEILYQICGNMDSIMYRNILIHQMKPSSKKLFGNCDFIFQT